MVINMLSFGQPRRSHLFGLRISRSLLMVCTKVAFGAHVPASHVEVWDVAEGFKLGKGMTINAGSIVA